MTFGWRWWWTCAQDIPSQTVSQTPPDFVEVIQTLGLVFTTGVSLFCTFKLQTLQAEWQKPPSQWLKEARQTLLMPLKTMPSSCTAEKCSLSLSLREEQSWSEPHWLPLAVALHSLCHSWPDAASIKRGFLEVFVGFLRGQSRKSSPYPLTPSFHRLWEEQFTQVELRWSETKDAIPWEKPGCELSQHSCCLSREKRGLESLTQAVVAAHLVSSPCQKMPSCNCQTLKHSIILKCILCYIY